MKLSDLLQFDNIIVQCHDNPDADALASGFGVYEYLRLNGKSPRLVYGGRNIIHKSNLVLMVDSLGIPIEHVDFLDNPQLLVTVDCQYGGGNVTFFKAENVAVIDHHRVSGELPAMNRVMSYMGSCATIVWDMLREEGVEINRNLATALYYGLYTDTGEFTEITHSLDRDLRDEADFDNTIVAKFRNANMSLEELDIAATALLGRDYIEEYRLAIVKAGACDPNVLGIISDFVLEVDAIDICMVFSVIKNGVKLSFRSCIKEVSASEMAQEVCRDIGSGGGHYYKAGGFIPMDLLIDSYNVYCKEKDVTPRFQYSSDGTHKRPSDSAIKSLLEERIFDYLNDTKIIYGEDFDTSGFKKVDYKKRPIPMGYIIAKDIIHAILCLQQIINNDPEVSPYLKVFMVENYNVTLAEKLFPAANISEQISLASKEASGTGNMKFMLNGAITLGTSDGANVEIAELVGDENIYVFGEDSQTVIDRYERGDYCSKDYYDKDADLKKAVDFLVSDEMMKVGSKENLERLYNELLNKDWFMTFPDFEDYCKTKEKAYADYEDKKAWAKKMLVNISKAGFFSSDRTIKQYNDEIWHLEA
ncbi:MAG: glycogen/starch/alpha-glucan phosphorylase [Agathobacter rectalis]